MALTLALSVSSTIAILPNLLLRTVGLCSSRWLRPAWRRANLPLPVTLNRLAADLRVLSLGTFLVQFFDLYECTIMKCDMLHLF